MLPAVGFAGSDALAAAILEALPVAPAWVLTRPPARRGRGLALASTPVAAAAAARGLEAIWPDPRAASPPPADLLVVVSYGRLLPPAWLGGALGAVNFHPSHLPKWRGAAPVARALMAGEPTVGACWMRLVQSMDAGPVLARAEVAVGPSQTAGSLLADLAAVGAASLAAVWPRLVAGRAAGVAQAGEPTLAPRLTRDDRLVDWARPAADLHNLVRALDPLPGARTRWGDTWLGLGASRGAEEGSLAPGALAAAGDDLLVGTGGGSLRVGRVVPAGRLPMSGAEFLRGWPDARLG